MALPDHYTGGDGEIRINGDLQTLVSFNLDVSVGVITQAQIGTECDKSYPGKKAVSGSITEVLVTGDLFAKLIGDTITTSGNQTLLDTTELDQSDREELTITIDPTAVTTVKCTLTVGDANTTAGSIIVHGTNSAGEQVSETLDFAAMTVGDAPQTKYGTQAFATTDFVTIMAALETGSGIGDYSAIKIEGVSGTKTITLGPSTMFSIVGKVIDANGKYWQLTAADCFFTGGSFPVGDREEIVKTDLPFTMKDPSTLSLVWTAA